MRADLKTIEKIDNYLLNNMPIEERENFEKEIEKDQTLKKQVVTHKLLLHAIKRQALKEEIRKTGGSGGLFKVIIYTSIIIAVLLVSYLSYNHFDKQGADSNPSKIAIVDSIGGNNYNDSIFEESVYLDNDFTFRGLNTWTKPDVQHFTFNANSGATIEGKNGLLIIVPSKSFLKNGKVAEGEIDLELVEALT